MAKILLAGLDSQTASEFSRKLAILGHATDVLPCEMDFLKAGPANLIFVSGDDVRCSSSLSRLRAAHPEMPFIVVSRVAEETRWLRALEAGATDFCGCTIDVPNLRWIVDNALEHSFAAVAAA